MRIGVPAERKPGENRVALTPAGAGVLIAHGHQVIVEAGAGEGSGLPDAAYAEQGVAVAPSAAAVWERAEMIVKVKEPRGDELTALRPGQLLAGFLHLAADPALTEALRASGATCLAFETVRDAAGRLPLLAPMSEVAGRLAAQAGAFMLGRPHGGRGVLISGVPGVPPARVMVIGGGTAGMHAAFAAIGMEAEVYVYDSSLERLRELDVAFAGRAATCFATPLDVEQRLGEADLIIGCVLVPGARAPHVISRAQLGRMRPGTVMVDVAIDQGGCFESSRPTTHADPVFVEAGVVHYCVDNMPGAVPVTATRALANATLPVLLACADHGPAEAARADPGLAQGFNVVAGEVTCEPVARATGTRHTPVHAALAMPFP